MADTQVLEACARKAWGFKSPLPHQKVVSTRKQRWGFKAPPSQFSEIL
jgi:hypothetical protein